MLIDNELVYSDSQAITADAASTNVLDLGAAGRAPGEDLTVLAHVEEAFDNLTSLTLTVQTATDAAFTTPVAQQSVTVALADLTVGKQIDLGPLLNGTLQYSRVYYDVTGTDPTVGKVTAAIVPFGQQTLPGQA